MSDQPPARWLQYVALTTTSLAVCAAISALRGSSLSTRVLISTTREANAWAYFQAKSIKQHVTELSRDQVALAAIGETAPERRAWLAARAAAYEADVARYDREMQEIQTQARTLGSQADWLKRHSGYFGLAVMLLQVSIMLSSVGALLKRPRLWVTGLVFGLGGLGYMAAGVWL